MDKTKRKIRVIEALNPFTVSSDNIVAKKLNVCAYARVSTEEEDQQNSYDNQISEYQKRITENPEWNFAGLYADKGISGTQIKRRESFKQMLLDARNGKIDLILTKSISRFGRNTIEILQTVRELRELNIAVFFEKENIYSNDSKLDFILTIMSSVAQEESRNISENIRWSVKKRFKEGKVIINTSNFLGYDKDDNGNLVIIPSEAEIVKNIFDLFIQGHSAYEILKILMKENKKTVKGNTKWTSVGVMNILQNEKYSGDAILQKTITLDYLTHRSVKNDNHATKYYVENNHEGIISKEQYNLVQEMIKKNHESQIDLPKNSSYPLTNLAFCSKCIRPMKRHVHHYGKPYQKIVLNCNHAPKNPNIKCDQKVIENDLVLVALNDVINELTDTDKLNELVLAKLNKTLNQSHLKADLTALNSKRDSLIDNLEMFVSDNVSLVKDNPKAFNETYLKIKQEIEVLNEMISKQNLEMSSSIINAARTETISKYLENKVNISTGILIRTLFKLVLFTTTQDLLIVLNGDTNKISEILKDFSLLDGADIIIDKTYYDTTLNKNITYKVVTINE